MTAITDHADAVFINGRITTLDRNLPQAQALAVKAGSLLAVGSDEEVLRHAGPKTRRIDLHGRRVIPGLNDSHTHLVRAGLNYNMELRWDGVPTLADAMAMLREQVQRTPAPQWVRVVGGFSEWQFAEKRLPTLAEINAAAPDTPVFILHLYDRALLNGAALRAIGYTRDTLNPPGADIQRNARGDPTGLLLWIAAFVAIGFGLGQPEPIQLYSLIALTGVAMGFRNATVRQMKVADLTTTVLTMTVTAIAADSAAAGGGSTNWVRRVGAILAIFAGALVGAVMLAQLGLSAPLAFAGALILFGTLAYSAHPAASEKVA